MGKRGPPVRWPVDEVLDNLLAGATMASEARRLGLSRQTIQDYLSKLEQRAKRKIEAGLGRRIDWPKVRLSWQGKRDGHPDLAEAIAAAALATEDPCPHEHEDFPEELPLYLALPEA